MPYSNQYATPSPFPSTLPATFAEDAVIALAPPVSTPGNPGTSSAPMSAWPSLTRGWPSGSKNPASAAASAPPALRVGASTRCR